MVFNEGFAAQAEPNEGSHESLREALGDETSRSVFDKVMAFRRHLDIDLLEGFENREREQYFEPFLDLPPASVFWDVGCFDGETTEAFARRHPDYRAVHAFEPARSNRDVCERRIGGLRDVAIWPYGASDRSATLRFSAGGSASSLSTDGEIEVEVRALDTLALDAPHMVKMDIEGAELEALAGARRTIARHRPVLAIAAYHRPSDIWTIPETIRAIDERYDIRLRHYTESIYETVMYFLPR